jgi:hypothetical protein
MMRSVVEREGGRGFVGGLAKDKNLVVTSTGISGDIPGGRFLTPAANQLGRKVGGDFQRFSSTNG